MATRKIKDARETTTNELIYFKGHAGATFMSNGATVEDTINNLIVRGIGDGEVDLSQYYTKYEIDAMGYLRESDIECKQDVITDLDIIRSGAILGSTALQSIPTEYAKLVDVEQMIADSITTALNTEV